MFFTGVLSPFLSPSITTTAAAGNAPTTAAATAPQAQVQTHTWSRGLSLRTIIEGLSFDLTDAEDLLDELEGGLEENSEAVQDVENTPEDLIQGHDHTYIMPNEEGDDTSIEEMQGVEDAQEDLSDIIEGDEETQEELLGDIYEGVNEIKGGVWDVLPVRGGKLARRTSVEWFDVGGDSDDDGSVYYDAVCCEGDWVDGKSMCAACTAESADASDNRWFDEILGDDEKKEEQQDAKEEEVEVQDERFGEWLDEVLDDEFRAPVVIVEDVVDGNEADVDDELYDDVEGEEYPGEYVGMPILGPLTIHRDAVDLLEPQQKKQLQQQETEKESGTETEEGSDAVLPAKVEKKAEIKVEITPKQQPQPQKQSQQKQPQQQKVQNDVGKCTASAQTQPANNGGGKRNKNQKNGTTTVTTEASSSKSATPASPVQTPTQKASGVQPGQQSKAKTITPAPQSTVNNKTPPQVQTKTQGKASAPAPAVAGGSNRPPIDGQSIDQMIILDRRKQAFPYAKLFDDPQAAALAIAAAADDSSDSTSTSSVLTDLELGSPNHLVIWTDASWSESFAGVAVVLQRQIPSATTPSTATNNEFKEYGYTVLPPIPPAAARASGGKPAVNGICYEMMAIGLGLERAAKEITTTPITRLTIFTDSHDALHGTHKNATFFFTGRFGFQNLATTPTSAAGQGIGRLKAPAGRELQTFESGCVALQKLWDAGVRVQIRWSPGHSAIRGNERADRVARLAARYGCLLMPPGSGAKGVKGYGSLLTPPVSDGEEEEVTTAAPVAGGQQSRPAAGAGGGGEKKQKQVVAAAATVARGDVKIMRLPVPVLLAIEQVMGTFDKLHGKHELPGHLRAMTCSVAGEVGGLLRCAGREEAWVMEGHGI